MPTTVLEQQILVWVTLGYEPDSVTAIILDDRTLFCLYMTSRKLRIMFITAIWFTIIAWDRSGEIFKCQSKMHLKTETRP